jgi:NitT/TauT family transport system substrate-binding protein
MTKTLVPALVAAALFAGPVYADGKIQIGCTATTDCASAMVAVDEGLFRKHGLDAEMVLIGIAWWIDVMSAQKMLQAKVDLNKLILN